MSQAGSRVALQALRGLIASGRLEPVLGACGTVSGMRTFSSAHEAHSSTFGSLSVSSLTYNGLFSQNSPDQLPPVLSLASFQAGWGKLACMGFAVATACVTYAVAAPPAVAAASKKVPFRSNCPS